MAITYDTPLILGYTPHELRSMPKERADAIRKLNALKDQPSTKLAVANLFHHVARAIGQKFDPDQRRQHAEQFMAHINEPPKNEESGDKAIALMRRLDVLAVFVPLHMIPPPKNAA